MVTPLDSANAFASTDREPATKITVYALPRSSFHLDELSRSSRPSCPRIKLTSRSFVDLLMVQLSNFSALEEVAIVQGPTVTV